MRLQTVVYIILVCAVLACRASNSVQEHHEKVFAFIQRAGLDSISRQALLKDNEIHLSKNGLKITTAVAYFSGGSFKTVLQQPFFGNKLGFLHSLNWVANAALPYSITISDIRYIDDKGNNGLAEDFSFIVY
ncbi:hypothetical protein [Ferruginibacter sp.]